MFSSHTVTNFDEPAFETTRASFPDRLGECKKPLSTSYATENYLREAFPTRAQQVTGKIEQEDHHECKGKGQQH